MIFEESPDSPPAGETIKLGEEEDEWSKKSKIPRMKMHADDVLERKSSAKERIWKSIRRRVGNEPRILSVEEIDDYEEEDDDQDMRSRINFKIEIKNQKASGDAGEKSPGKGLNERFHLSANLRSRLGAKEADAEQEMDDDLEHDQGHDLGPEGENMMIQVTQTKRNRRNADQDMDHDMDHQDHRDVDHRQSSSRSSRDLRSKISSEVVRIKKEKGVIAEESRADHRRGSDHDLRDRRRREMEAQDEAEREARRRQRSERRVDRDDQEERRRRREHERRHNDSRVDHRSSWPSRDHRDNRRGQDRDLRDHHRDRGDRDRGHARDERRRDGDDRRHQRDTQKPLRIKKVRYHFCRSKQNQTSFYLLNHHFQKSRSIDFAVS